MERAMQIIYQKKYCCNCGKWFKAQANRFLVCSCGCTDAVEILDKYGVVNTETNTLSIYVSQKKLNSYKLSDYAEVIFPLYKLPILQGAETKRKILNKMPELQRDNLIFNDWPAWKLLSHWLNLKNSELYKALWERNCYRQCEGMLDENFLYADNIDDRVVNEIQKLPEETDRKIIVAAIGNIISSKFNADISLMLARNGLEAYELEEMIRINDISQEQAIADITECAAFFIKGEEIISTINEYYSIMNWFEFDFADMSYAKIDPNEPIYMRLLKLKNTKKILVDSGVYATRRLIQMYQMRENSVKNIYVAMYNGLIAREATMDEVKNCPLIIKKIPPNGVSAPPYVILRGQEIESVVFTTQSGEIIIEGKSDDDHKIVANKFLDSVY